MKQHALCQRPAGVQSQTGTKSSEPTRQQPTIDVTERGGRLRARGMGLSRLIRLGLDKIETEE